MGRGDVEVPAADAEGRRRNGSHAAGPAVGSKLQSLFAELTSGPMPDHLLRLMDQLESTLEPGEEPPGCPARNGRTRHG